MGFKVVIAGGSVSGLSLANMLEKFDIDYVLLEAYPEVAPQVGASIGLLSNGFRILDQIGCYEPIRDISNEFYLQSSIRGPDGRATAENSTANVHHLEHTLGYPSIFIDRQMLLQVLYDNLKYKDRVLTKKRVSRIDLVKGGVQVHTDDGSVFEGDIVVGADGIHSAVRSEMWRLGHEQSPGYFPTDEESRVPVDTKCIFGISKRPAGLPDRSQQMVHHAGRSYLIVHAPGNRTYWFLFKGVDKTLHGKEIPRYSKDDLEKLAREHLSDRIYDDVTFGTIYKNRIMSTLVPLEEYVFDKWHYKRVITIGDASHKIDPISGQGGNGAIEAAALLVNALADMLEKNPKSPTESEVISALSKVHENRHARAKALVSQAHQLQMILTGRSPVSKLVTRFLMPILGDDAFLKVAVPIAAASHRIERLPVPKRLRIVPFNDELPARPIENKVASWAPWVLSVGSLGFLLYHSAQPGSLQNISRSFNALQGLLQGATTGVATGGLVGLGAPAAGNTIETIRLRANLFSTLAVWFVEGSRQGNRLSVLPWPATCAVAYSLFGAKALLPSLGLSTILMGSNNIMGRHVRTDIARSLLPSLIAGYAIPTVLASLPIQNPVLRQAVDIAATLAPVVSTALFKIFPSAIQAVRNIVSPPPSRQLADEEKDEFKDVYQKKDVAPLKRTYAFAAGVCAVAHVASAIYAGFEAPGSLGGSSAIYGLASVVLSSWLTWDMRARGLLTTKHSLLGGLASAAGSLLLGPGAGLSAFFYWREHVISGLGDWF